MTAISKVTNANVYIDSTKYLGKAEQVDLPEITFKMTEHETLGMFARVELPDGLEKMEASFTWNAFYPEIIRQAANPYKSVSIQVRAVQESYDNTGRISEIPLVILMTGTFKSLPMGSYKQHEAVKCQTSMSVLSLKMIIDGEEIIEIDTLSNKYKVEGIDLLQTSNADN